MITLLPALLLLAQAPPPGAREIMSRVAENQQRAQEARNAWVYDMNVLVRLQRANGKLAREETRDYVVAPTPKGAKRQLLKLEGTIQEGKKQILYSDPHFHHKNIDVDGDLTSSFAEDLLWKKDAEIAGDTVDWFPLTPKRQKKATFQFEGEEKYRGYDVYKIAYEEHDDGECWTGEALIEKTEFQPVLISTSFSCKIPGAVKVLLGTNVTQLGAKITYERVAEGIWFPVNCGGEVKFRVLFLYARTLAFSARNTGFHKTDIQSTVTFGN